MSIKPSEVTKNHVRYHFLRMGEHKRELPSLLEIHCFLLDNFQKSTLHQWITFTQRLILKPFSQQTFQMENIAS